MNNPTASLAGNFLFMPTALLPVTLWVLNNIAAKLNSLTSFFHCSTLYILARKSDPQGKRIGVSVCRRIRHLQGIINSVETFLITIASRKAVLLPQTQLSNTPTRRHASRASFIAEEIVLASASLANL